MTDEPIAALGPAFDDPAYATDTPDLDLADLAIRAVAALRLEFGGVDILLRCGRFPPTARC